MKSSKVLGYAGVGVEISDTFDYFRRGIIDSALITTTDVIVDLTSMYCGYPGLSFDILWHWKLKDAYWYYNDIYVDQVIIPQYSLGILGLPGTMPFK